MSNTDTNQTAHEVRDLIGRTYGFRHEGEITRLRFEEALGDGLLVIRNLETGGPFQAPVPGVPGAKIMPDSLWAARGLSEETLFELHKVSGAAFETGHDDAEALARDPKAAAKLTLVRELARMGVGPNDPKLSKSITRLWKEHGFDQEFGDRPETKTVRTWFKGDPETLTVSDLMSRSGLGKRASRVHARAVPILDEAAEYFYEAIGLRQRDARARLAKGIKALNAGVAPDHPDYVPCPSRETLRRRIAEKLDREHYARKYGEAAAKKNWDGAGRGLEADRIGQLGVMDDTVFDNVACFDGQRGLPAGRPYLCILVDVKSRCIVGYLLSFEPPTAHTALETIRAANRFKNVPKDLLEKYPVLERINCKFEEIVVDRGANYTSHAFGQALLDVGTALRFARVRHARDKAIVERLFHTIKTFVIEKIPGATFAPKLMREFGYDPEKVACLTVSELREIIEHFIAVYHITVHSGIGMQPALAWSQSLAAHGRHMMTNTSQFAILTGETLYGVRITREGMLIDGIRYIHDTNVAVALDALAGAQAAGVIDHFEAAPGEQRPRRRRQARAAGLGNEAAWATVKVKRNTANLLRVHAFVPGHGWLEFEAANTAYADGLSLYQHKQIGKWAQARNMAFSTEEEQLLARDALVEHINELAPSLSTRERRAVARMTREGAPDMSEVDHQFAPAGPNGPGVIEAEACDVRSDALIDPAAQRSAGKKKKDDDQGQQGEAKDLLRELMALEWESPVDEDEVMEEHA